jgi:hypothetical protein
MTKGAVVQKPTPAKPVVKAAAKTAVVSGAPNSPQKKMAHVDKTNNNADGLMTEQEQPAEEDARDLAQLATDATAGDQSAVDELARRAEAVGISADEVTNAPSWSELVETITASGGGGEAIVHDGSGEVGTSEEEVVEETEAASTIDPNVPASDPDWLPQKGDVYFYTVVSTRKGRFKNSTTGKITEREVKEEKDVECEVKDIAVKARTVNLFSLDTKTHYKGISFDALLREARSSPA